MGKSYRITIPNYLPASLNRYVRRNKFTRSKFVKEMADLIVAYNLTNAEEPCPNAQSARRVSMILGLGPRGQQRDVDNCWKVPLDALVRSRQLVDDSPQWLDLAGVFQLRTETPYTTIILEELP